MSKYSPSTKLVARIRWLRVLLLAGLVFATLTGMLYAQATVASPAMNLDELFQVEEPEQNSALVEQARTSPLANAAEAMRLAAEAISRSETGTAADAMQQAIDALSNLLNEGDESRSSRPTRRDGVAPSEVPPPIANDAEESQNVAADPSASLTAADGSPATADAPGTEAAAAAAAVWGQLPERLAERLNSDAFGATPPEYRESVQTYFLKLSEMEALHRRIRDAPMDEARAE